MTAAMALMGCFQDWLVGAVVMAGFSSAMVGGAGLGGRPRRQVLAVVTAGPEAVRGGCRLPAPAVLAALAVMAVMVRRIWSVVVAAMVGLVVGLLCGRVSGVPVVPVVLAG